MSSVLVVGVENCFAAIIQKDKKVYSVYELTYYTSEQCRFSPEGDYTVVFGKTREALIAGLGHGYPDYTEVTPT